MADIESEPLIWQYGTTYGSRPKERNSDDAIRSSPSDSRRKIGWTSAYILIISRVIGSGIFAMPGTIVQHVGSPGLALILWVLGALIAWSSAVIDLEFGCLFPRSGGIKIYLEKSYPRPKFLASTMVAVQVVLLGFTATNCIVFAKYVLFAARLELADINVKSLAVCLLSIITVVHGCFPRAGIHIQNVLGWLKIVLVAFIILTGVVVVALRPDTYGKGRFNLVDANWDASNLTASLLQISYSYAGLSNINNILSEVRNPVGTLKTVVPSTLITACVMYVLINIAYLAVIPLEEIKQSGELVAALFFNRVFGPGLGDSLLPVAIAVCAAGNVMVVTFSLARLNQEVARQGFLPYAHVIASNRPFDAPLGGLVVHFIPSMLVIVLPPSSEAYAFIAQVEGYAGQFFALAVAVGLLLLRYREPILLRPFRAWIPVVWFRIGLCLALIIAPFMHSIDTHTLPEAYTIVAILVLMIGMTYWAIWTKLLPYMHGYHLEERGDVSVDGTHVTRLVRIPTSAEIRQ